MIDRELLELAAKAAGLLVKGEWVDSDDKMIGLVVSDGFGKPKYRWAPLADDGDALRLAVRLKLHVGINQGNTVFCTPTYSDKPTVFESCERDGVQDPYAATRRAIVRVAAEGDFEVSVDPDAFHPEYWHCEEHVPEAEVEALRSFAKEIMAAWPEGGIEGDDLQAIAIKHGLLEPHTRHAPCREEGCVCAGYVEDGEWEAGVKCFSKTPLLNGAMKESKT